MIMEKPERSSLIPQPAQAPTVAHASEAVHQELVLRILASRSFSRSERLSALLKHICELTLKGRVSELNEQNIGQAVFGRVPEYDSSADGIVRTQASRLRQRLLVYFEDEGSEEPIRLIIPKGGYVPVFAPRFVVPRPAVEVSSSAAQTSSPATSERMPAHPVADSLTAESRRSRWLPTALLVVLLCVLATALAEFLLHHHRSASASDQAAPHLLWSQLFIPQHRTLEVPGDSGLVMFHRCAAEHISLNEYLLEEFRSVHVLSPGQRPPSEIKDLCADISNRRYTSIVDLDAAVKLAQIAQSQHSGLDIRYARDLRPNDLKNGNIILIGAFEANPWLELFEPRMNFVLKNNYRTHVFTVVNKAPHPGEANHWESVGTDPQRKVYGVVAYMPNLSGNGSVLIIQGTAMAGTEAAWDFVSDDAVLLPFLKKLKRADGTVPHFELLLGTLNMGASAVHSDLIAWRLIN